MRCFPTCCPHLSTPDDRYILYAAMVTNSVILSNDKFGYEMDRVNRDEIAKLVRKWLDGSHAKINIDRNAIKLFVSYCMSFRIMHL